MREKQTVRLYIVSSSSGECVVLNDRRIAGGKPWGGGEIAKQWDVSVDEIKSALFEYLNPEKQP